MGLDNIQQKKNPVLNRPMFARMRDGRIVPVQHAWVGAAIQAGKAVVPWGYKFGKNLPAVIPKIKSGLPSIISKGGKKIKDVKSSLWKTLGYGTTLGTAPFLISEMTDLREEVKDKKETKKPNMLDVAGPKKVEKEEKVTEDVITDVNSGSLDDMITERIDLFKDRLGGGEKRMKMAGFGLLTELGLNLMSARGGNLVDKIARSAKDPLKTFNKIGEAINNRMDKITMAGIESGVRGFESEEDRKLTRKQIAAEAKPQDVKTLEYFMQTPGLKDLPIKELIRLSKNKAIMSDKEFYQEFALSLTNSGITDAATINELFTNVQAASPDGGGGGQPTFEEIEIKIKEARSADIPDSEIKAGLEAMGVDPSKHGL